MAGNGHLPNRKSSIENKKGDPMLKLNFKRAALVVMAFFTLFGSLNAGPLAGRTAAPTGYLFVGYSTPTDGLIPGVVVYKIREDGSLSGAWTNGEAGGRVMNETARSANAGVGLEGVYETTGTNPNGSEYRGKLNIERVSDKVYTLIWSNSDRGTGILAGDTLVVGYGAGAGVALYVLNADGSAEGFWTTATDEGRVGTENFGASKLTGDHATRGTRPDGGAYSANLTIDVVSKSTNVYRLKWDTGHQGVGIYLKSKN